MNFRKGDRGDPPRLSRAERAAPEPLNTIGREAHANAVAKGFYADLRRVRCRLGAQDQAVLDNLWRLARLALVHSEISEAVEAVRDGKIEAYTENGKPEGLPAELADAIIRIVGFAAHQGIDMDAAVKEKAAYNATRAGGHGRASKL